MNDLSLELRMDSSIKIKGDQKWPPFFYSSNGPFPSNTARFNVGAIPVKKEAPADAGFKSTRS